MLALRTQLLFNTLKAADPSASGFTEKQNLAVRIFFGVDTEMYYDTDQETFIGEGADPDDVCTWYGISCTDRVVRGFGNIHSLDFPRDARFSIDWIPNTVTHIKAAGLQLHQHVNTRTLPRPLEDWEMANCTLTGTLNLQTLPPAICKIRLYWNDLYGRLFLARLPATLRIIQLPSNRIERVYVSVSEVHSGFLEIHVCSARQKIVVQSLDRKSVKHIVNTQGRSWYAYDTLERSD